MVKPLTSQDDAWSFSLGVSTVLQTDAREPRVQVFAVSYPDGWLSPSVFHEEVLQADFTSRVSLSDNPKFFASSGSLVHHVDQHYFCPLCTRLFKECNSVNILGKTPW